MAVKNKPFKRFTFADGFYCYARGYGKMELEREMMGHGPLVKVEREPFDYEGLFPRVEKAADG